MTVEKAEALVQFVRCLTRAAGFKALDKKWPTGVTRPAEGYCIQEKNLRRTWTGVAAVYAGVLSRGGMAMSGKSPGSISNVQRQCTS